MPVPHFNIKITQRSKGKSAVAGAAYQAGEKLFSEYDQKTKNYTCKKEVVYTAAQMLLRTVTLKLSKKKSWLGPEMA